MCYVYILLCENNSLHTGVTTDVARRFKEHEARKGAKYTRSFKPIKILYKQRFRTQSCALKRELEIKDGIEVRNYASSLHSSSKLASRVNAQKAEGHEADEGASCGNRAFDAPSARIEPRGGEQRAKRAFKPSILKIKYLASWASEVFYFKAPLGSLFSDINNKSPESL